jgi:methylmalonyl-CoA/ethylmalonyl-CoA epimerase
LQPSHFSYDFHGLFMTQESADPHAPFANGEHLEFDHLGIIVSNLEEARQFMSSALAVMRWTEVVDDPVHGVSVQFGSMAAGSPAYELIAPLQDASPISNALKSGKHILNHVAYLTLDLRASGNRLREAGCYPVGEAQPAVAYGGALVQFWMSPLRFVIELIEKPGYRHKFLEAKVEI